MRAYPPAYRCGARRSFRRRTSMSWTRSNRALRNDRLDLAGHDLVCRVPPALAAVLAFDAGFPVEDLDTAIDRVGEDRREARLVLADGRGADDLVVGGALGRHLEGLHDLGCGLGVRYPPDPGERRAVVARADDHRFTSVADRRSPARREALARQLLLRAQHVGGRRGRVELVDGHQDVGDQRPEGAVRHRLPIREDVDPTLAQEGARRTASSGDRPQRPALTVRTLRGYPRLWRHRNSFLDEG